MEAFGWCTQAAAAPSCPNDDALLAAFLGASSFEELHSTGDGTLSSEAYGALGLAPPCQNDLSLLRYHNGATLPGYGGTSSSAFLDSVGLLPALTGADDGFAFPNVQEEPKQAAGSNAAFSGYSTTTAGGNISSGDSNTYGSGGHDTEVASPPCAVSGRVTIAQAAPPESKRNNKLPADRYPAAGAATTRTGTSITFGQSGGGRRGYEPDTEAIAQVKEMIYRAAAMRPVSSSLAGTDGEPPHASTKPPSSSSKPRRRKNVRISSDPQTVAARLRRERVSERLRALQRLVPGGSKMDTASMLDEAASYLRFLKSQVAALETLGGGRGDDDGRYSSPLHRYAGRSFGLSSSPGGGGGGGSTVLAFGRDGVAGYVKSNRNMQL